MRLQTTVVGSFPVKPSRDSYARLHEGEDPFRDQIETTVMAQLDAGIDLVSDGQVRAGMVDIFADRLRGMRRKGRAEVFSEIEWTGPITTGDVGYASELAVEGGAAVKGLVTGPYTMAMSVVDSHYGSIEKLAYAFAEELNHEVLALQDIVGTVQVDEPFMSVEYPEYAKDLIDITFRDATCERALHVCGDVSGIFADLTEFTVDILDHEFYKQGGLLPHVEQYDFAQKLGYGSIDSTSLEVEELDAVVAHIERALDAFPEERIVLDPDCGLKHVPEPAARRKLEVLVEAARIVERRSGT